MEPIVLAVYNLTHFLDRKKGLGFAKPQGLKKKVRRIRKLSGERANGHNDCRDRASAPTSCRRASTRSERRHQSSASRHIKLHFPYPDAFPSS